MTCSFLDSYLRSKWFISAYLTCTSAFRVHISFLLFWLLCCCMLNLQIVSFQEEFWKNNSKTFQTNVFKGHTDNAFVFICKGLWQLLCSIFCLCILSALIFFYCSCCGFFVGACFICSFRVFGGLLLKMVQNKFSAIMFVFFVSPQRLISQREIS